MDLNPFELMKNMKGLQENMQKMQENLPKITATGSSGAGMVDITINGKFVVTEVKIAPEIVDPEDISTLQVLIASAFNDASNKIQEKIKDEGIKFAGPLGSLMPQV